MKKLLKILAVIAIIISQFVLPLPVKAIYLTEIQTEGVSLFGFGGTPNLTYYAGQSLISNTRSIYSVTFRLYRCASAPNDIYYLVTNSANVTLRRQWLMNGNDVSVTPTNYQIIFNGGVAESGGHILLEYTAPSDAAGSSLVMIYKTPSVKANECFVYKTGADDWTTAPALDAYYEYEYTQATTVADVETLAATDISYDNDMGWFIATLCGWIDDDGGEDCDVGFYYKLSTSANWTNWYALADKVGSDTGFFGDITGLQMYKTYNFIAYAINSAGYHEGSAFSFYTGFGTTAPSLATLMTPMTKGTDNVTLFGKILSDGSSNVTAGFRYLCADNVTWLYSSNVTLQETDDIYSVNITGLLPDVVYSFKAYGVNNTGYGEGGIGHFILYSALTAPTMVTVASELVDNTQGYLRGSVSNYGGSNTYVRFQYRKQGDTAWIETNQILRTLGDTDSFLIKVENLTPNQAYEFRAKGWHLDTTGLIPLIGYGSVLTFVTFPNVSVPVVRTDNATYINDECVRVTGTLLFDGGSQCQVWFRYRELGLTAWVETNKGYGAVTNNEFLNLLYNIKLNVNYEWQACALNSVGSGYGSVKTFKNVTGGGGSGGIDGGGGSGGGGGGGGTGISGWLKDLQTTLGMTGIMGTWAFMGLFILLIALVFGMAIVATSEKWIKTAIAVAWLLTSVSIVGAFIFTGALGVWPILILVGGLVVLIILIVSVKFSGGGIDG